jgi:hypothetical protein
MIIPSQDRLQRFVNYNPKTGLFTWKARGPRMHSGRPAGILHRGYVTLIIEKKRYRAHRLAWLYVHGEWPELLDHVNGDPADNRLSNLRLCTVAENTQNRKRHRNNASGYKGVTFHKMSRKWEVCIMAFGKKEYLGLYSTAEKAAAVYDAAAQELHGEFARTNAMLGVAA